MDIELDGVSVSRDGSLILDCVDFGVEPGEIVGIQGASGAGKSTLLQVLAGLIVPDDGRVLVRGDRVDTMSDRARSSLRLRELGIVFQRGDLIPELTVGENVALPLRLLGHGRRKAQDAAMRQLEVLGIAELSARHLGAISGGQAQRAALARALVHEPSVLLADEPTGALDAANASAAMAHVVSLARTNHIATVVVTHDSTVAAACDRTVILSEGTLREAVRA